MKRWLVCGAVLMAAVLLIKDENRPGVDIAKLEPAQIISVEEKLRGVVLRTDAGHSGWGRDLDGAISDMEASANGLVFLDTAEYLLVATGAEKWVPELTKILRSSCQICQADAGLDLKLAAEYLTAHPPGRTLGDWQKGNAELPMLYYLEERMYLAKP